jgi:hypothetical protein
VHVLCEKLKLGPSALFGAYCATVDLLIISFAGSTHADHTHLISFVMPRVLVLNSTAMFTVILTSNRVMPGRIVIEHHKASRSFVLGIMSCSKIRMAF